MKHRVFLALGISKNLKNAVLAWEEQFKSEYKETYSKIRWLKPENLHITLIPPWYEDEEGITKAKDILNSVEKIKFTLQFHRLTYGPNPKRPRLVWLEGSVSSGFTGWLHSLYRIFNKEPEKRPFTLHLTIGRFKEKDFSFFTLKEINEGFEWSEETKKISLMEAHLQREGAEYQVLHEIDL